LLSEFLDGFSTVRFRHADDNIFAAAVTPNAFTQHAERFSHAGGITQE